MRAQSIGCCSKAVTVLVPSLTEGLVPPYSSLIDGILYGTKFLTDFNPFGGIVMHVTRGNEEAG